MSTENFDQFIGICRRLKKVDLVIDQLQGTRWTLSMIQKCKGLAVHRVDCQSVFSKYFPLALRWKLVYELLSPKGITCSRPGCGSGCLRLRMKGTGVLNDVKWSNTFLTTVLKIY